MTDKKQYLFEYCQKLVIFDEKLEKIFLAKRIGEADYDGTYAFIGGKMEITDENIVAGLKREKDEEVGTHFRVMIDASSTRNLLYMKNSGQKMILPHYAGIYDGGEVDLSDEYSEYAWVSLSELKDFEPKIPNIPEMVVWAKQILEQMEKQSLILI